MSRRQWYVACEGCVKGQKKIIIQYTDNKNESLELAKKIDKINLPYVDFQWKESIANIPFQVLHGKTCYKVDDILQVV